ncbi:hypothetical protein HALLA_08640 [Halostagnicola larsenii XH-48]|uniref:Uncharacterized protein n=1 Tax=Halostagnicola larsenii XH-48 TaxID=797299 RepID=W0JNP9_9EURY|nr:hypothetical protein [Halostagnicola larsenii]AHF98921.1 hypothetical protein HALLA_08640 [Halostagnicola larsenii XH-48]
MKIDVVETLHQPEYTGDNRCEPCTILNLVIAALLSSLIARKSKLGGVLALGCSIGLIYLRGYLIPGTPTLTKRYLPPAILRWFGKDPEPVVASGLASSDASTTIEESASETEADELTESTSAAGSSTDTGATPTQTDAETNGHGSESDEESADDAAGGPEASMDLETYFLDEDILEPCADSTDLCLTEAFETAWFAEIEPIAEDEIDPADAAEAFGFEEDPDEFELLTRDDVHTLRANSSRTGQWPSRPALVADIAASRAFESWVDDWDAFGPAQKGQLLNSLRMFLETCPTTGGDIQMGEEVVESCCSSHKVFAVTCEDTDERLFEHRISDT